MDHVFMKLWLKLDYIPVLNMITDSLRGIKHILYFKREPV